MAQYGVQSMAALATADQNLITLFDEVVKSFDNKILYGYRDPVLQFELFKLGRAYDHVTGLWSIIHKSKVVTYKDGVINLSNHNYIPSRAVDVAPYPINWGDTNRIYLFAGYVLATARKLLESGAMTKAIRWGGDWNQNTLVNDETFLDLVHFEVID
jgi:peptidoglycan L-alanyl-D-glutamate endopeptidase CwlK